jgi:excisionase family DNA binding protein
MAVDESNPDANNERYITTREAAALLGVNRATVINWARQGRFGGIQYGNRGIYRFERREILEFLNRSRLGPNGQTNPTAH